VAVVAHADKHLGGGLAELREVLSSAGVEDPLWYEVAKSKRAPGRVRKALKDGAGLVFVWGGDGMVQRCVDALAGTGAELAILPAGTANLLATNLDIPKDIRAAVHIGLHGRRRSVDLGRVNGERFAVMAGTGFDALMIRDAGSKMKDRFGRLGYVWTGMKHLRERRMRLRIRVDGKTWFKGRARCTLVGNVGKVLGGIPIFDHANIADGRLELGVLTANGLWQWARALGRTAAGQAKRSPFMRFTTGTEFDIKLDRKTPYELDGGERKATRRLRIVVEPGALTLCVPEQEAR
jgi:YegS/Rv2252/BmrU family lipid kinase